jgi:alpha-mannosidase
MSEDGTRDGWIRDGAGPGSARSGGPARRVGLLLAVAAGLLPGAARATAQELSSSPAPAASAVDTLFLIGDARIDRSGTSLWQEDPAAAIAAWRRALGFGSWTRGAVLTATGADSYEALARHQPVLMDSLRTSVRSGSWSPVGGWTGAGEVALTNGEAIVRSWLFGQSFFATTFGRSPTVAWFPGDRPLPATLPQILAGSGVRHLLAGRYAAGSSDSGLRGAFEWVGNDGTKLFGYVPFDYGDFADFEFEFPGPVAEPDVGRRHRIAVYGVRDPGWKAEAGAVRDVPLPATDAGSTIVRFAAPEDALAAVQRSVAGGPVPVIRGELAALEPGDTDLAFDRLSGSAHVAHLAPLLQAAEALAAVTAGLPDGPAYPRSLLNLAWRELLSGNDISQTGVLDSLVTDRFGVIRREMDTRDTQAGAYVLFNPLGQPRSGAAFVEIGRPDEARGGARAGTGRDLLLVNIPDVPALGAATLPIGPDGLPGIAASGLQPPAAGDQWMENAFLRVEIDPATGAITRILDKTNRRQALRPDGLANVLSVTASDPASSRSTPATGGAPGRGEPGEFTRLLSMSSSVTARAATITLQRGWGASTVHQQLVLGRSARFLEVRTELDWRDAGWKLDVRFDPVVSPEAASFEIPYGVATRRDGRDSRSGAHRPTAGRWASVEADGYGLSVISDRPADWSYETGSLRLALNDGSPSGLAGGRVRFAIYPHAGSWLEAGTHRLAAGYSVPLLSALEPAHGGRLGERFSLVSLEHPTVGIEWLKRAEDGDALVLRLVNWGDAPADAEVETACPEVSAWRSNPLEEPGAALPTSRSGFRLRLRAHEIATVRVECG